MSRIAVIGSGPAGFYVSKYLFRNPSLSINMFEASALPFGLVRWGIAPDHPETKSVMTEFTKLATDNERRFKLYCKSWISQVDGRLDWVRNNHDFVVYATGAQKDGFSQKVSSSGSSASVLHVGSRQFVSWYNDKVQSLLALDELPNEIVIVGMGNVAMDIARVLSLSSKTLDHWESNFTRRAFETLKKRQASPGVKKVTVLGRSGFENASFANKEFRELGGIPSCLTVAIPNLLPSIEMLEKSVESDRQKARALPILKTYVQNYISLSPSTTQVNAENVIELRFNSELDSLKPESEISESVMIKGLGSSSTIRAGLVIHAVGFKIDASPFGLPVSLDGRSVAHDGAGLISGSENEYVVGWLATGPRGVIPATLPLCAKVSERILERLPVTVSKPRELDTPSWNASPYEFPAT